MAELVGQGPVALPGATSVVFTTPFPIQLGTHARDASGNEYLFVDFTGTVYGKQPVEITDTFTAQAVGTTGRGPVGVAVGVATSDQAGWVQIYGAATIMLGMSGVSPSDAANGPTTLSTSAATLFILGSSLTSPNGIGWVSGNASTSAEFYVEGITVAHSAAPGTVSATTSATSHTGGEIAVFLNYPRIVHRNYGV